MAGNYSGIMTEKQAFEILIKQAGSTDARIILRWLMSIRNRLLRKWRFHSALRKLRRGVPVAKILGVKWFYGLEFETGRHTLDPRPDSETLVEAVLNSKLKTQNSKLLDLGTGTGCLICAIIKNMPGASGIGIDKSWRAACVARRNVKKLDLNDRIKIIKKDFHALCAMPCAFDIIISNPPYIATGDARVDAGALHDPAAALYAGADGLDAYRIIAQSAKKLLKQGGRIYLEIGAGQSAAVREIFTDAGWQFVAAKNDLSGLERVLIFE